MAADSSAVAAAGCARASLWPSRGSRGASAKWNSARPAASTGSGPRRSRTPHPAGGPGRARSPSSPRARSWSIARAGIDSTAAAVAAANSGDRWNTARCETAHPTRPAAPAAKTLPARSRAALRPRRAASSSRRARPTVTAATVGASTAPSTAMATSAARTTGSVGACAIARALAARAAVPARRRPRLRRVASIRAPIGAWRVMPTSPLTVSTAPRVAGSQPAWVTRNTPT